MTQNLNAEINFVGNKANTESHNYKLWNHTQMSIPIKHLTDKPKDGDRLKVIAINLRTYDEVLFTGTVKYSTIKGKAVGRLNFKKNEYIIKGDVLAVKNVQLIKKAPPPNYTKPKRRVNIDTGDVENFLSESNKEIVRPVEVPHHISKKALFPDFKNFSEFKNKRISPKKFLNNHRKKKLKHK